MVKKFSPKFAQKYICSRMVYKNKYRAERFFKRTFVSAATRAFLRRMRKYRGSRAPYYQPRRLPSRYRRRKNAVAMYRGRNYKVRNYSLKKRAVTQQVRFQAEIASHSHMQTAALTTQDLTPNLWVHSFEPVKNQSLGNETVRVGDSYNITNQVMRFCIDGGTDDVGNEKSFCCRLFIIEWDVENLSDIASTEFSWRLMFYSNGPYGTNEPEITNWVRDSRVHPFPCKFKVIADKTFVIGTDGSSIPHKDLKITFPRRQVTHDRNHDANNSIPIKGKAYSMLFIHDGDITDHGPVMTYSMKWSLSD